MEIITSRHNYAIKHLTKLLESAKYRRKQGESVAEGIHVVQGLLQAGYEVRQLVVAESAQQNREVEAILQQSSELEISHVIVKDSLFTSLGDIHAAVGVMAVFCYPADSAPDSIATDAILLEDVQDPGNIGTILRTAAAAGIKEVYMSAGCASAWSPKALRAGMGAHFGINIFQPADLVSVVRLSQVPVLTTSLRAQSSLYAQDLRSPVAWLFGSEGQGVSPELEALASGSTTIPQSNPAVESLNVAAAAAVCLYEQLRQRLS